MSETWGTYSPETWRGLTNPSEVGRLQQLLAAEREKSARLTLDWIAALERARDMRDDEIEQLEIALAAEREKVARLTAALVGLMEMGEDEPLMVDPSTQRCTFWFCGGTTRKGHAADCPWIVALAATSGGAPEGREP